MFSRRNVAAGYNEFFLISGFSARYRAPPNRHTTPGFAEQFHLEKLQRRLDWGDSFKWGNHSLQGRNSVILDRQAKICCGGFDSDLRVVARNPGSDGGIQPDLRIWQLWLGYYPDLIPRNSIGIAIRPQSEFGFGENQLYYAVGWTFCKFSFPAALQIFISHLLNTFLPIEACHTMSYRVHL